MSGAEPAPLYFPGPGTSLQWAQYPNSTTFTVPANVKGFIAMGCGAGGSGGNGQDGLTTASTPQAGGGGGGGSPLQSCFIPTTQGDSVTVTIPGATAPPPDAGAAGAAGANASVCDTTSTFCCYFLGGSGGAGATGIDSNNFLSAGGAPNTTHNNTSTFTFYGTSLPGAGGYGANSALTSCGSATSAYTCGAAGTATNGNDLPGLGVAMTSQALGGQAGPNGAAADAGTHLGGGGGGGGGAGGGRIGTGAAGGTGGNGEDGTVGGAGQSGTSAAANSCAGGGGGGAGGEGVEAGAAHGSGGAGGSGFITLSGPPPALTGLPLVWTQATLPGYATGDYCQSIIIDPVNPGTIVTSCGNNDGRAIKWYRTYDFGENWALVNSTAMAGNPWGATGDPNPTRNPSTPLTIYSPAGYGSYGAWKSTDTGSTWTRLTGADTAFAPVDPFGETDLYEICVLPDNPPNHVFATYHYAFAGLSDGGFGQSTDGGITWTIDMPPTGIGTSHYVMPVSGTTWDVIAQNNNGANGIWETINSATSWTQVATSDSFGDAEHVHGSFTPLNISGIWYAPTWTSIWVRSTGGAWSDLLPQTYFADPPNPPFVGQRMSGLAATSTYVYSNYFEGPTIARAPIGSLGTPSAWVTNYTTVPSLLNANGANPLGSASTYDAVAGHWLLFMATNVGVWRMIE